MTCAICKAEAITTVHREIVLTFNGITRAIPADVPVCESCKYAVENAPEVRFIIRDKDA